MRDQLVRGGPFFSTAASATMRTHDRAIDAPQLLIELSRIDDVRLEPSQHFVQGAIGIPSVEETVHRFPGTELVLGQVSPGRTRTHDP